MIYRKELPRREFLRTAAGASAGLLLGNCGSGTAPEEAPPAAKPFSADLGAGLFTLRELIPEDPEGVLSNLAAIGYRQVEPLLFYPAANASPEVLEEVGLEAVSAHILTPYYTGRWEVVEQLARSMGSDPSAMEKPGPWEESVEKAKADGIKHLVVSSLLPPERQTADQVRAAADEMNKAAEVTSKAGVQLCFHNHADDLAPLDGTTILEIFQERFDKELVKFEMDVCWLAVTGEDPVTVLKQNAGRVPMIHLKDLALGFQKTFEAQKIRPEDMKFPGEGSLDFPAILKAADEIGVQHYFVEHDYPEDAIAGYRDTYQYLRSIEI